MSISQAQIENDRKDYEQFLIEYGFTPEWVKSLVENEDDQVPMPSGFYPIDLKESEIHGKGMFSTTDIPAGHMINPARIDGKRTPAGRYTNHSEHPNAKFLRGPNEFDNDDLILVSSRAIKPGEEITIDYRQACAVNGNGWQPVHPAEPKTYPVVPQKLFNLVLDPDLPPREQIAKLISEMMDATESHVDCPVTHSFAKGMYIRSMFIKKGQMVAGGIHKHECINICAQGDIEILTETGYMRVIAPYSVVTPAGIQRIGVANEDTTWINIFQIDETDIGVIEKDLIYSHEEMVAILDPDGKYFKKMEKLLCQ